MALSPRFAFLSIVSLASVLALAAEPALAQSQGRQAAPRTAAAPPAAARPKPPIELSPDEQQRIDQLLDAWEKESNKVESFKCKFTRWDYDRTFGPKDNDFLMAERKGEIKFRAPDKGTFKETSMKVYEPPKDDKSHGNYVTSKDGMEHWVCDGNAIYQFKPAQKVLEISELPEAMRGKAITEGPLPFIFGAKANTLRQRYWIHEVTPREEAAEFIWLEAFPKFAQQAAEFKKVRIILTRAELLPFAMEVYLPNGQDRTAYAFEKPIVNELFGGIKDFLPPMTPFGWRKVVNPANPPAAQAVDNPLKQATRPKGNLLR